MRSRKRLFWIGIVSILIVLAGVIASLVTAPPRVRMVYYSPMKKRVIDRQTLLPSMVKQYGREVALVRQYFEGPLVYAPEVWFLDAQVKGVWVIPPRKAMHLVVNMSEAFVSDVERHPLLVQRWLEGLFQTIRENRLPIRTCSVLVEGKYRPLWVGSWNLFYPLPLPRGEKP